jgi:hypothetical protein
LLGGGRRPTGARPGKGVRIAEADGACDALGAVLGLGCGAGCELALVAGINVPTGRQLGMPSRQTRAPSPSLPPRRARMSCSIVICTNSVPPRSTYQSGFSVGAIDGCRGRASAGEDARPSPPSRSVGRDTRSSSSKLTCAERPRPPSREAAVCEFIRWVESSSSNPSPRRLAISTGGGVGSERRSANGRSRRTKYPQSQRRTRCLRASSPFVT